MVYSLKDGILRDLGVSFDERGALPPLHLTSWPERQAAAGGRAG